MKKIAILLITAAFLAGCSNITDLSDTGYARITTGESSGGRYIANPSEIKSAVLGFVEKDKMFNFADVEDISNWTGEYLFTGIPVGDYSFLAMLMNSSDDIIGMKIQGVTIEPGLNEITVEMGPGFEMYINSQEFDIEDLGDSFTLSLDGNEVTIGIPSAWFSETIRVDIENTWATGLTATDFNGSPADGLSSDFTFGEVNANYGYIDVDPSKITRFQMTLTSEDNTTKTSYRIILKAI